MPLTYKTNIWIKEQPKEKLKPKSFVFRCMVVRMTGTDNEQIGNEWLTADEIVQTVDGRRGGNYLTVYETPAFITITPITIEYKSDAKRWANIIKDIERQIERR